MVLSNVLPVSAAGTAPTPIPTPAPAWRADSGVMGLAEEIVDTESADRGLVVLLADENAESGLSAFGDAPDDLDLPFIISLYSEGDGFHDVR